MYTHAFWSQVLLKKSNLNQARPQPTHQEQVPLSKLKANQQGPMRTNQAQGHLIKPKDNSHQIHQLTRPNAF